MRLGSPLSISYKQFFKGSTAVEVFGGLRGYSGYRWVNVGGALQIHKDLGIDEVPGLSWYYGGGASVFFWTYDNSFLGDNSSSTSIGILGTIGLDYKFEEAPVNLSLDWMPIFFVNGFSSGFGGGFGALSVRYVLK